MALRVDVQMLSGDLLQTLHLPTEATAGDVRTSLGQVDQEKNAAQADMLQVLLAGGATLLFGSENLKDTAPLRDRVNDQGVVTLSLVLSPSPLAGKTFHGTGEIQESGVYGSASGRISFKEDDTCDVHWSNGYTSAGHADSAHEGEFEATVVTSLPKVTIKRKGKGRRRSGRCYGGFEEDAWQDDDKDYTLEGEFNVEDGLKLSGWKSMSHWNEPLDDCFLTEKQA
eukprot:TRINITY_DN15973_c0_g2_i1.p1 TRINITY_DN15973_c0_g2~~TRINITY_DN15973_c0_g2_i1.p1  ORF type:complete len:248 (-),score=36.86 TRINITY_DN15973_c0_g2_i1:564-1241(-)